MVRAVESAPMTVDQRGIHHHGRNLCRSLGKSLDCLKPAPPTGATRRKRPPRGAILMPRPLAEADYTVRSESSKHPYQSTDVAMAASQTGTSNRARFEPIARRNLST